MSSPQRREPGIRRRMRLWFVRQTLWEKRQQDERGIGYGPDKPATEYRRPWTSPNALAKFSMACACSMCRLMHPRYRDVDRRREKAWA